MQWWHLYESGSMEHTKFPQALPEACIEQAVESHCRWPIDPGSSNLRAFNKKEIPMDKITASIARINGTYLRSSESVV